jgi:hypothetical protein
MYVFFYAVLFSVGRGLAMGYSPTKSPENCLKEFTVSEGQF